MGAKNVLASRFALVSTISFGLTSLPITWFVYRATDSAELAWSCFVLNTLLMASSALALPSRYWSRIHLQLIAGLAIGEAAGALALFLCPAFTSWGIAPRIHALEQFGPLNLLGTFLGWAFYLGAWLWGAIGFVALGQVRRYAPPR